MREAEKVQLAAINELLHKAAQYFSADGDDWERAWKSLRLAQKGVAQMLGYTLVVAAIEKELEMHRRLLNSPTVDILTLMAPRGTNPGVSGSSSGEGPTGSVPPDNDGSPP